MTRIGTTDLDVYPLILGSNTFGWTSDRTTSFSVLDAYVSAGGNFIDTSDSYTRPENADGDSETILGHWLSDRGHRDDIVLATKVGLRPDAFGLTPANIAAAAEASLRRLDTDHIDIYYAHLDDDKTPLIDTVAAFDALVTSGKVRHIGLSNYSPDRVSDWIRVCDTEGFAGPIVLQPNYSLVAREPFESGMRPLAEKYGLAVTPYWALASGFLTGKYRTEADLEGSARGPLAGRFFSTEGLAVVSELDTIAQAHDVAIATVALAWTRQQPTILAPIASARVPEQLPSLLASVELELAPDEIAALNKVSKHKDQQ